jgi:hypothetical protein
VTEHRDAELAQSAGLGSIGAGPTAAEQGGSAIGSASVGDPARRRDGHAPTTVVARRHVVGVAVVAVAAVALCVGGLRALSGARRAPAVAHGTSVANSGHGQASLAAARVRYDEGFAASERDPRSITTTTALAITGNATYADTVAAWNRLAAATKGLSLAALQHPASATTSPDIEALVSTNNGLISAVPQFEQDPTSQAAYAALKGNLLSSAAAAAQVQQDLGIPVAGLHSAGGA